MPGWYLTELETMWDHPDMTAEELSEFIPRHSAKAIRNQRSRMGRHNPNQAPLCIMCGVGRVDTSDRMALKYGMCPSCWSHEKELRERLEPQAVALRQQERRARRRK